MCHCRACHGRQDKSVWATGSGCSVFYNASLDGHLGWKKLDKERAEFTEYWTAEHSAPTIETMMLDTDAASLDKLERPERLGSQGGTVSEGVSAAGCGTRLGAGIGRFSGVLARQTKAKKVVAVDFVATSCVENRKANADQKNLEVLQVRGAGQWFSPQMLRHMS
eukprot:Skav213801  [mRNA]  locus=scaffold1987:280899:284830:- [translate_table: standard]